MNNLSFLTDLIVVVRSFVLSLRSFVLLCLYPPPPTGEEVSRLAHALAISAEQSRAALLSFGTKEGTDPDSHRTQSLSPPHDLTDL